MLAPAMPVPRVSSQTAALRVWTRFNSTSAMAAHPLAQTVAGWASTTRHPATCAATQLRAMVSLSSAWTATAAPTRRKSASTVAAYLPQPPHSLAATNAYRLHGFPHTSPGVVLHASARGCCQGRLRHACNVWKAAPHPLPPRHLVLPVWMGQRSAAQPSSSSVWGA